MPSNETMMSAEQPRLRANEGPDTPKYFPSGVPKRSPRGDGRGSRTHGVMIPGCPECAGPVVREYRGGPVLRHTHQCSIPARPRTWPRRPAVR